MSTITLSQDASSMVTTTSYLTMTASLPTASGMIGNYSYPLGNGTSKPPSSSLTTSYPLVVGDTYTASYTMDVTIATTVSGSSEIITSTMAMYSLAPTPAAYTFRPDARDNLAVYYGQTPNTTAGGLLPLCEREDVDIVIIAFLNSFFGDQNFPVIDFGPGCDPPTTAQQEQSPGLLDCPTIASQVTGCQNIGKKVLLSLGGWLSNTSFVSDNQAVHFAETLWNLFGGGRDNLDIRPFGPDVVVDGFDIDNEHKNTSFYNTFATELRSRFKKDPSKDYYISAAPQCPIPDMSIPLKAMQEADFVWVQFYNNKPCNLNTTGFKPSFEAWSKQLANGTSARKPRLYIGAAGFVGAGSGYVDGSEFGSFVHKAREANVDNLGGVMLLDGSEALMNVDQFGDSYLDYAKAALQ